MAEDFVAKDGELALQGHLLKINFKMKRVKVQEDKDCWFCFENESIDRDLIVWSGTESEHFYIAMPKGPVCDDHFLIVPKRHIAHSLELTEVLEEEFMQLRDFLINYILNTKRMDYLLFERNSPFKFEKAAHMNIQIMALPPDVNLEDRVRKLLNTFQNRNTNQRQNPFIEIEDRESDLRNELNDDPSKHFFYLQIPGLRTARGR